MVLKTIITDPPQDPEQLRDDPHHLRPLLHAVMGYVRPERILDPTAGSGISATVAEENGVVPCLTYDLNDPTDETDLFSIEDEGAFDLVVYHPDLWRSRPDAEHPHDLGATMSWDAYVELNRDALMHLAHQLRDDGHLLLIAPLARRGGHVRSLARDLQCLIGAPKEPEMVHPHPYCRSRGTLYGKRFIPIAHDNVLLYTKEELLAGAVEAAMDGELTPTDEAPARAEGPHPIAATSSAQR